MTRDQVMEAHEHEVSFVVICFNEESTIARCLTSILAQREARLREVLVVNDGSTDGTAAEVSRVAATHPVIRLITLPHNRGRRFARRVGSDAAGADYVAYVDADIVLPGNWLERCLAAIADCDVVGGVAVPDRDLAYIYRRCGLEPRAVSASTTITGNNGLYRRWIFGRATFDPLLRDGEDVALNHELEAMGARARTLTDLLVRHEENKTFLGSLRWLFESGRGATRQLRRYRRIRVPDLVFLGWILSVGNALFGTGRSSVTARALPVVYTTAAAAQHVRRGFAWQPQKGCRWIGAVAIDVCLLTSYLTGRLVGLLGRESR